VQRADYLVALDVSDTDDALARVHLASAVELDWLPRTLVPVATWDATQDRVLTAVEVRAGSLLLERRLGAPVDASLVEEVLCQAVAREPRRCVPLEQQEGFARLLARIRFASRVDPAGPWPSTELNELAELAVDLASGCRSLADLVKKDWAEALLGRLSWAARQRLDEVAPERIEVPSGSRIFVDYPLEGTPVLAVRMQELFGCRDTPRIGGQAVMLHLLAPNGRPQQVTQDLAGFWERTWPEVRKELRPRYPKHSWPDDPTQAVPQVRPPRRS
jgi:ATP-dependent helicase HrpB